MPVQIHSCGSSVTENVVLHATQLVAATAARKLHGRAGCFEFSGVEVEGNVSWGEAWALSGMKANCTLELREREVLVCNVSDTQSGNGVHSEL